MQSHRPGESSRSLHVLTFLHVQDLALTGIGCYKNLGCSPFNKGFTRHLCIWFPEIGVAYCKLRLQYLDQFTKLRTLQLTGGFELTPTAFPPNLECLSLSMHKCTLSQIQSIGVPMDNMRAREASLLHFVDKLKQPSLKGVTLYYLTIARKELSKLQKYMKEANITLDIGDTSFEEAAREFERLSCMPYESISR